MPDFPLDAAIKNIRELKRIYFQGTEEQHKILDSSVEALSLLVDKAIQKEEEKVSAK